MGEFIVYVCPVGELAQQVEAYLARDREECGENEAHRYPPHCTLAGFFHDRLAAILIYTQALGEATERARPTRPPQVVAVTKMTLREDFHGLVLNSDWLKEMIADFERMAKSPTRGDRLRPKSRLHLSLAYGFPPRQHEVLAALAKSMVDPQASVRWELRLYERFPGDKWAVHANWPLD